MTENETPIRARRRTPAGRALALVTAAAIAATGFGPAATPAYAQGAQHLRVIRDTEIENLLRDYARPILKVAGLAKHNIKVVIINDQSFNAFVMDGRHIFVNAGALFDTKTPNEMIGVLAHETGHLADGHLMRLRERLARAQTMSIVSMIAGIGAAVAGARAGVSGSGNIGAAAVLAPQAAIRNSLLAFARTQEDQADHAAVKFLTETHQSAKGMVDLFKRLSNDMLFASRSIDPYMQNHLMRAKLSGFLERPDSVLRRYPLSNHSLPARYARAISAYRNGGLQHAIGMIDDLIRSEPNNPYFHELKGQALLEGGHPAEAIAPLRRAVALSHHAPLISIMLGQAMVATNQKKYAADAVQLLQAAVRSEPDMPGAYEQLAMAYGREGNLARADLASAHAAFSRGDIRTARLLASRAKTRLKVGSPAWVRADDIVNTKVPQTQRP
jgi:predicted Zn-dependent protease